VETLPEGTPLHTFEFLAGDLFDKPDSAKLKDKPGLKAVGAYLETHPFGLVVIQAFTGLQGEEAGNLVRTQAQALAVRHFLAENFRLEDAKLRTLGMGEAEATVPGKTHWLQISIYGPLVEGR
jgi:outer membrane protein OmpA-like peptidoglycan-associated protein